MSTILVLGNGFDLKCGLKSRYTDYFKWCEKSVNGFQTLMNACDKILATRADIKEINTMLKKLKMPNSLTLWDLYFIFQHKGRYEFTTYLDSEDVYWRDVEEEMKKSFTEYFWDRQISLSMSLEDDKYAGHEKIFALLFRIVFKDKWSLINSSPFETQDDVIYKILLSELNRFERRFSIYIQGQLNESGNYFENQQKIIDDLIEKTTNDQDYQVVTFNYTPIKSTKGGCLNIHGTLNNPIFGISYDTNKNKNAKIFTKSYRRSELKLPLLADFIKKKSNNIIFYGVSFSDLDLDYYKNIVNLFRYKKIYYCYSDYGGTDRRDEFEDVVFNISKKITRNGYFSNREKGRADIKKIL